MSSVFYDHKAISYVFALCLEVVTTHVPFPSSKKSGLATENIGHLFLLCTHYVLHLIYSKGKGWHVTVNEKLPVQVIFLMMKT